MSQSQSRESRGPASISSRRRDDFGQRLYQQGLATEKKKQEARIRASIHTPKLKLATHARTRSMDSTDSAPRFIRLYELAKERNPVPSLTVSSSSSTTSTKDTKDRSISSSSTTSIKDTKVRSISTTASEVHKRLYRLSSAKQQAGKEKREQIQKSKIPKPTPPPKKISSEDAANLYDRLYDNGVQKQMSMDRQRVKVVPEGSRKFSVFA